MMNADVKWNAHVHRKSRIAVFVCVGVVQGKTHTAFIKVSQHFAQANKSFAIHQLFVNRHLVPDKGGPKTLSREIFVDNFLLFVFENHPERRFFFDFDNY